MDDQVVSIANEIEDSQSEGASRGTLGTACTGSAETRRAFEFYVRDCGFTQAHYAKRRNAIPPKPHLTRPAG